MTPIRRLVGLLLPVVILACSGKQEQPVQQASHPAPDSFQVRFETSRGPFVVEAYRSWAPRGVDRFYELVQQNFYDGVRFFRVLPGFMAQFGINGDPKVNSRWRDSSIVDDSVTHSNKRGTVTFAKQSIPNSRSTQLFINYADNDQLDGMDFAPIGIVKSGMSVVDSLYSGYGEGAPAGNGPDQTRMTEEGNVYLKNNFPKLDSIVTARVVKP